MRHLMSLAVVAPHEHSAAAPACPLLGVLDLEDLVTVGVGSLEVLNPLDRTVAGTPAAVS